MLFLNVPLPAQTPRPNETPGRYLLIVETSDAMRRRADNTRKLLNDLILSGLNGQLRSGDTLGVWTFSDTLHTGVLPLQRWTPENREKVAASLTGFLQAQRYEKSANLEPVLPELAGLVKESDKITVLLVGAGGGKIHGTPYDEEINETYALNHAAQEKARLPYVTVLRAVKGGFAGYTVSTPPWPVEFPAFPTTTPRAEASVAKETVKPVNPLVVTGKKSGTNQVGTTSDVIPQPKPAPPPTTPSPATLSDAEKELKRREALRLALEGGKVISLTATSAPTAEAAVIVPPPAAPAVKLEATAPPPASQPPLAETKPAAPLPFTNVEVAVSPPIPAVAQQPAAVFQTVPATNAAPPPEPKPVAPIVTPPPVTPPPVAQAAPEVQPPVTLEPPPFTEEAPAASALRRNVILIGGGILLLAALALFVMLLRRPTARPPERISLITRSLDKEKK